MQPRDYLRAVLLTITVGIPGCSSPRPARLDPAPHVALTESERRALVFLIDNRMARWPASEAVCLEVTDGSLGALPPDSLLRQMVSARHSVVTGQACRVYSVGMRVVIPSVGAAASPAPSAAQVHSHKLVLSRPVKLPNGELEVEWQDEHEGTVFKQRCSLRERAEAFDLQCDLTQAINY